MPDVLICIASRLITQLHASQNSFLATTRNIITSTVTIDHVHVIQLVQCSVSSKRIWLARLAQDIRWPRAFPGESHWAYPVSDSTDHIITFANKDGTDIRTDGQTDRQTPGRCFTAFCHGRGQRTKNSKKTALDRGQTDRISLTHHLHI